MTRTDTRTIRVSNDIVERITKTQAFVRQLTGAQISQSEALETLIGMRAVTDFLPTRT